MWGAFLEGCDHLFEGKQRLIDGAALPEPLTFGPSLASILRASQVHQVEDRYSLGFAIGGFPRGQFLQAGIYIRLYIRDGKHKLLMAINDRSDS